MSRADAWMPLYVGDYLADTTHLTLEQSGAYLHLLMSQWRIGYVPADPSKLAAICRVSRTHWVRHLAPAVLPFFEDRGDRLVQLRLEAEAGRIEKLGKNRPKKSADGAKKPAENEPKSAENAPRLSSGLNDVALPLARASARVPSQSQSQSEKREKEPPPALRAGAPKGAPADARPVLDPLAPEPHDPPPAPAARSSRGHRLAADWQPNAPLRAYAVERGLNPDGIAEAFRDFWHAAAGTRATKLDWDAAWRTWCRNEVERRARGPTRSANKLDWWGREMAAAYGGPPPDPPPDPHADPPIDATCEELPA